MTEAHCTFTAELQYVIDGTADDDTLQGDGEHAPFYIFSPPLQSNVAGPFASRAAAEASLANLSNWSA